MFIRGVVSSDKLADGNSEKLVEQLIAMSHARPADRITVAGGGTLDVLLGLCRRGFLHAAYRTASEGSHVSDQCADYLWIVHAENAADLRTLIAACARDLRPDGTLVAEFASHASPKWVSRLNEVLSKCGFTADRTTDEGFLVARKTPPLAANAA